MNEFDFKPVDQEGAETLSTIAEADRFNQWMYRTIKPWCFGQILEIGSGLGNISAYFLQDQAHIFLSDIREVYCDELRSKFGGHHTLQGIQAMDLADPDFDNKFGHLLNSFDTVFALNVLEHIFNDQQAIENGYRLLKPGGHLVILVPAFQRLYNNFDKELEHYRRYNKSQLKSLFLNSHFQLCHSQYFNAAGMAGWLVSGSVQKHQIIPAGQMRLYNRLVPFFKLMDTVILHTFGLSVIVVGEK